MQQAKPEALTMVPGNAVGLQSTDTPPADDKAKAPSGFRADVEGLRALSVLLVIACHAGIPFLAGGFVGVDVFFVISGFLITGLLFREAAATGRVSIRNFYARRARRILPMAALVLLSVCLASWLLMPAIDRAGVGTDVTGAALFVSNWVFAAQANDYFAMNVTSSPVLHFWSLSVEEQFYLIWPVLVFALAVIGKRRGLSTGRKRALIGVGLALPIAASLAWS
ncbi:MAG: acyltransferase, partial [Actinomycetes bacterium]